MLNQNKLGYYLDAWAIRSNSFFLLTEGDAGSLLAERIRCSAKNSSIGFGLENVASFTPSAINRNAKSTLLSGATSTETWYTDPPYTILVVSSFGAEFSTARTKTSTGFFPVFR